MRTIPPALLEHLRSGNTTTAICWIIEKRDGSVIRGTDHDDDIEVPPTGDSPEDELVGVYYAGANITASDNRNTSDMSVDNAEVDGATADGTATIDVTVADIEAGLFDGAPVTQFLLNWAEPGDGQVIVRYGYLGEVSRDSDRKYTTELRGLKQLLTQIFVRTYSERCQVKRFGDDECKFPIETVTITGTVTAVTNAKRFDAALNTDSPAPVGGYYNGGELRFITGENAGYMRELKRDDNDDTIGHLSLWERFPFDPAPGDVFELSPGCPRTLTACKAFGNVVNFRGYGVLITGMDALARGAGL
jgi:uncharacterized phage protein (TIGR02218 family)